MEAWPPPLGFAPLIGAVQWPSYVGPNIGGFGPSSGPPPVVVVGVVGAVDPGVIVGGTSRRPKCLLLLLWFPRMRSGRLLRN